MKRKVKSASLYEALEPLLERGAGEEELAAARKAYRRAYQTAWRKQKRQLHKEFTISLTKDELAIIAKASKGHKKSKSRFIKEAALAYLTQTFLVPDREAINLIRELLTMNYTALQTIFDEQKVSFIDGKNLLTQMETLEREIRSSLQYPKRL